MKNFRQRPKANYIHEASWEQLYVLTEHWKLDVLFYKDDLRFLHHLIDSYFLLLSKRKHIDMVQEIEVSLLEVDKQCDVLLEKLEKHIHHLTDLIDDPFIFVATTFRDEHELLEDDMAQFVKDFRNNRKEIFTLTEYIIEDGSLVRQFNSIHK